MAYCFYNNWETQEQGLLNLELKRKRRRAGQAAGGATHVGASPAQHSSIKQSYLYANPQLMGSTVSFYWT